MRNEFQHEPIVQLHHKEDTKSRIKIDTCDRQALHEKLEMCIDPLLRRNIEHLVHIMTGHAITNESVNSDDAFKIGTNQMLTFVI